MKMSQIEISILCLDLNARVSRIFCVYASAHLPYIIYVEFRNRAVVVCSKFLSLGFYT